MLLMKYSHSLRIASVIALLFAIGHTMGAMESWSPPGETAVLDAMRSFRFDAMGVSRTYSDFYFGFGLIISVFLLLQAGRPVAAHVDRDRRSHSRSPLDRNVLHRRGPSALLAWKFIFTIPVVFSATISIFLGLAFVAVSRVRPS